MFVLSYVLQVSDELENNENKSDAAFSLWIFMAAVSNFLPLLLFVYGLIFALQAILLLLQGII